MRSIILIEMTILLLVGVAQADDSSPTLSSDIGHIHIFTEPAGGSLYVDGNYEGTTHSSSKDYVITDSNSIPVTAGYHNIEIFKDGYEKYSTSIYVDSGYSVTRYVTLIPISTPTPTPTATSLANTGYKTLTIGESWDIGRGYILTASSIDAKATPRQVWLVLSKDGVKLDDKVLSEGQTYNFNDIFLTKINRIWAGPTSDLVELTDTVVNLASNPTPTPSPIMTPVPTETLILQTPEPQDKTYWINAIFSIFLISVIALLLHKLKPEEKPLTLPMRMEYLQSKGIENPTPEGKPRRNFKISWVILIMLLIAIGSIGYTFYQKYSPLTELANCGNNCIDYKKVRLAEYETSVPDIKITNADADKLIMDVPIIIRNPSAKDTETVKIDFDMSMEGKHLTKGTIPAYELPANQNTTILIKDVVIKYEELGDVLQKVAERHGTEVVKEGKANISMTTDLLIYFPIEIFSINIYTFTIPIQIESEVPVDMLKQNEEAKKQIEEKVSTAIKEVQEKIKDTLPAIPTKTIPSPTATLPQKTALPLPTPSSPQFP